MKIENIFVKKMQKQMFKKTFFLLSNVRQMPKNEFYSICHVFLFYYMYPKTWKSIDFVTDEFCFYLAKVKKTLKKTYFFFTFFFSVFLLLALMSGVHKLSGHALYQSPSKDGVQNFVVFFCKKKNIILFMWGRRWFKSKTEYTAIESYGISDPKPLFGVPESMDVGPEDVAEPKDIAGPPKDDSAPAAVEADAPLAADETAAITDETAA